MTRATAGSTCGEYVWLPLRGAASPPRPGLARGAGEAARHRGLRCSRYATGFAGVGLGACETEGDRNLSSCWVWKDERYLTTSHQTQRCGRLFGHGQE